MRLLPIRRIEGGPWQVARQGSDVLDRFFNDVVSTRPINREGFLPAIDLTEREKDILVKAELPGLEADEIDLTIDKGHLIISGVREGEKEEETDSVHYRERSFGKFRRAIKLPDDVDNEKVNAEYKNGVLEIILPRVEGNGKKTITINAH